MELALFIKKRIEAGEKKKTIAEKLCINGAIVTQYIALLNMPTSIEELYRTGKCGSVKTIYVLCKLHSKYPDKVDQWCLGQVEVTERLVEQLEINLINKIVESHVP